MNSLVLSLALSAIVSPIAFVLMWLDKRAATRGRARIPEATLHLAELAGGWPGSLLAQRLFRHKTVKPSYRLVFWSIVVTYLGATALAARYLG
ncbi:MAG: DUF1294 domain-containing protein [Phycisphaerales bacterium]|jgi:uncharacterized membrane protein YsdA (DUF1294 family)